MATFSDLANFEIDRSRVDLEKAFAVPRAIQSVLNEQAALKKLLEPLRLPLAYQTVLDAQAALAGHVPGRELAISNVMRDVFETVSALRPLEVANSNVMRDVFDTMSVLRLPELAVNAVVRDVFETMSALQPAMLARYFAVPGVAAIPGFAAFGERITTGLVPDNSRAMFEAMRPVPDLIPKHILDLTKMLENLRVPRLSPENDALRGFLEDQWLRAADDWSDAEPGEPDGNQAAAERDPASVPSVIVRPFPPHLLEALRLDPAAMSQLTPDQFQFLIADRLDRMGFEPRLTGRLNSRDGGIDIIAVPRTMPVFGCLVAVQCEHHRGTQKTDRRKVRDLLEWKGSDFQLGVVVTNTTFTRDARLAAERPHNRGFLRLRGFDDVARWVQDNYTAALEWRDLPEEIVIAPGIVVRLR